MSDKCVGLSKGEADAELVTRSNSVLGLVYSAKAGVGVAPLPTAIGDAEPDLVQVLASVAELTRIWRLLTPPICDAPGALPRSSISS